MAAGGSNSNTTNALANDDENGGRRKADFHETVWGDFFITHVFTDQETVNGWMAEIEALKEEVKTMITSSSAPKTTSLKEKLHLIDVVERLGIGYHFEAEIEDQLRLIRNNYNNGVHHDDDEEGDLDLFTTALRFRLLRQHRYNVPSDIFEKFKNEEGKFEEEEEEDVEGMMSLYEAAYLQMPGETILEEAIEFVEAHLTHYYYYYYSKTTSLQVGDHGGDIDASILSKRIGHMLERPLRKGVDRHEQLFFISVYEQDMKDRNETLLKLAKLSWNHVQSMYQQELRAVTRWWMELDFVTKLRFARDRLVEVYFWGVAALWEPKFALCRYFVTKLVTLVSVLDDIYDVHGKIHELEFFTSATERWDTSMKDLPEYMKIYYEAVIDVLDEVSTITTAQGRPYCAEYAKQEEKNLARAYLEQARWFATGKVPTVEEYRRVGIHSSTYPMVAFAALCGMGEKAPKETFDWLATDPKFLVAVSDHGRIMDDIVTHEFEQMRGHEASVVECYMKQYEVSTDEAVDALRKMVEHDWKDINQPSSISKEVTSMLVGLTKVIEVLYKDSDGYTFSDTVTKDIMTAVFVTPMVIDVDVFVASSTSRLKCSA